MADIINSYFANLFSSSNPSMRDIAAVTDCSDCVVGDQLNAVLCAPFSREEVRRAVFDIHPSKAQGLDGFTTLFYQKFWPMLGKDIMDDVLLILNDQRDLSEWNSTLITLIPKVK